MVKIPRSAKLTESFTGTDARGIRITCHRYGPLTRGGKPIEWVSWEQVMPSGTTRAVNEQVTGRRIATIDDAFAGLATKYPVNANHTRH
jgi:hypothetical protein